MRCPNCQYEAIGEEPKQCLNCGFVFPQSEKSSAPPPESTDKGSYAEHNNLSIEDDDLGIESTVSYPETNPDKPAETSPPSSGEDNLVIGDTTPPNPYETNTSAPQPATNNLSETNGSIKRLSDDELKKIEKNLYKNDSELISKKEKSSLISKIENAQKDDQPLFENEPIKPPPKAEVDSSVDIKEATKEASAAIDSVPKPQIAAKSRGIAYFYKHYIELVGSQVLHPDDELIINTREYILKPKKIQPKYMYVGIAAAFVICLIAIGSFFISDTMSGTGTIVGMALDDYEQPYLTGAQIRLVDEGKSVETNPQGFFKFEDIPSGSHRIQYLIDGTVIAEDYITVTGSNTSMTLLRPEYANTDESDEPDQYSNNIKTVITPPPTDKPEPPQEKQTGTNGYNNYTNSDNTTTTKNSTTTTTQEPPKKKTKTTNTVRKNRPGKVTLSANVESAKLKIDGNVIGAGNLTYSNIKPGTHSYTVSSDGYESITGDFNLRSGETEIIAVTLKPLAQEKKEKQYDVDDFYYSAQNSFEQGNYQVAIKDLNQVINNSPSDADAYFLRAQANDRLKKNKAAYADYIRAAEIYQFKNDYNQAISAYNGAIDIYPKEVTAYLGRGNLYLNKNEALAALADFDKVIQLDKRNFNGYFGMGKARFQQEQYRKAIDHFKDARSLDGDNSLVHQYLMICYMFDNDYKNVKKSYDKFVDVATDSERTKFETDRKYSAVMKIIKTQ